MALHTSTERHLGGSPAGAVITDGYSLDLQLDQVGIFSKSPFKATARGLKALSDFTGVDKEREKLSILMGSKKNRGKIGTDKNKRTIDFALKNVKRVGIAHEKDREMQVDYYRVGWDGVNDETTIKFSHGQTIEFSMGISGVGVSFFNTKPDYVVRTSITIPNIVDSRPCGQVGSICDPIDCREHTLQLVKQLREYQLPYGGELKDYFDIYPIFSKPKTHAVGETFKQWKLKYCGHKGNNEMAKVAAQYPGQKITRDSNGDFVLTAKEDYVPAPYKVTYADIIKGCEACLEGYTLVEGGYVYAISMEDEGVDNKAIVAALPNAVADTAIKTGSEFGIGRYFVIVSEILTEEQIKAFVDANPTAVISYAGSKVAFCENKEEVTHEWKEIGGFSNTCHKYRIIIADDCKGDKLKELQKFYPNLEITKIESKNCFSIYETTVYTNTSCTKGCNPDIIEEMYASEVPSKFGMDNYWFPHVTKEDHESVFCGFEVKAKPVVLAGGECIAEEFPFIMTSTKITHLAGGYPIDYSMNAVVSEGTWIVNPITTAKDVYNLGGNLRGWEKKGQFYFEDVYTGDSPMERELTGTHSRLGQLEIASDLFIEIDVPHQAGFEDRYHTALTYHILVPYGKTKQLEDLFKKLAAAAGVPFEVKG